MHFKRMHPRLLRVNDSRGCMMHLANYLLRSLGFVFVQSHDAGTHSMAGGFLLLYLLAIMLTYCSRYLAHVGTDKQVCVIFREQSHASVLCERTLAVGGTQQ